MISGRYSLTTSRRSVNVMFPVTPGEVAHLGHLVADRLAVGADPADHERQEVDRIVGHRRERVGRGLVLGLEALHELLHLRPRVLRKEGGAGVETVDRIAPDLQQLRRVQGAGAHHGHVGPAELLALLADQRRLIVEGRDIEQLGLLAPQLREHAGEVLVRLEVRFHGDGVGAHLLGRLDEEILAHDPPVVVDVEHRQPLLAQLLDGVARHEWALARLRADDAEAPRAARREVRMRGRRGQLHHARAVVDRLGRQAGRAAEVADLGHDACLSEVNFCASAAASFGSALLSPAVDHDGTPLDAACRIDPLDAKIDGLLEELPYSAKLPVSGALSAI